MENKGFFKFRSDPNKSMLDVASDLGKVFKVDTMPLVQTLTPRIKGNEPDNTYSGNFGLNEFPFHTDLAHWYIPPRYILLRCVNPAKSVATKFIDRKLILDEELNELIGRAHFRARKRLDRKANLMKILHENVFRWDSLFITPANKAGKALKEKIEERIQTIQPQEIFLHKVGDCILVDNWRMLHSRGSIDKESIHRKVQRVYFNEVKL